MISQTVLDYNQIVWIRLAHRLYSDFQYFFHLPHVPDVEYGKKRLVMFDQGELFISL